MKVTIPETPKELLAQLHPDGSTADFSFASFVSWILDNDSRFTRDAAGLRSGKRIISPVEAATTGEDIELDAADWRMLCDAAKAPSQGYPVRPARLVLPYIDAIEAAKGE